MPLPTEGTRSPPSVPSSPAASSIYGIARRHARERLIIEPRLWTSRQLELLRISFDEPSPAPKIDRTDKYSGRGITGPKRGYMKYHLRSFHLSYWFAFFPLPVYIVLPNWKISHRDTLPINLNRVSAKGLYSTAPGQDIYLRKPRAQWLHPEYPIGAYIDRGRIEELRKESLHLNTCNPQNAPVYSILSHKLEQLKPANPFKDPYIAALLIAVAQYRRYVLEEKKSQKTCLHWKHIQYISQKYYGVLYSLETQSSVYLYKADIPASFLDMFDHPAIAPPASQTSIQVFEIPHKPVGTFRDRILALVLPTTLDRPLGMENSRKRKRN
ncbi:hypothetical protein LI328DRAFT_151883 [Trichoderma asperelloides]|nr:hypothetical protein LI328DRAFT_151883 [Trichoderma asperelloides]